MSPTQINDSQNLELSGLEDNDVFVFVETFVGPYVYGKKFITIYPD